MSSVNNLIPKFHQEKLVHSWATGIKNKNDVYGNRYGYG